LDPINNAMQSSRCKGRLQSKLMLVHRCKWKITINLWAASYTKHASFSLGKVKNLISQEDGTTSTVMLKDTYLVPDLWDNLFSLTKALTKEDTQLSNEEECIKVTSEDYSIKFDRKFSYGRGTSASCGSDPQG